jgi:hypothetical protein
MIKLHEIEQLKLNYLEAGMARALLTDIHYYLDHGITDDQVILVLKKLVEMVDP